MYMFLDPIASSITKSLKVGNLVQFCLDGQLLEGSISGISSVDVSVYSKGNRHVLPKEAIKAILA